MIVRSELTNQLYDEDDCVFFRNPLQSAFYRENGANLIDIFTRDGKWVWVFSRKDHNLLRSKWKERREENERGKKI